MKYLLVVILLITSTLSLSQSVDKPELSFECTKDGIILVEVKVDSGGVYHGKIDVRDCFKPKFRKMS